MSERETLFECVREALETLGSDAANADDLTGQEIANEGLTALATIESGLRDLALNSPQGRASEWFQRRAKELLGA